MNNHMVDFKMCKILTSAFSSQVIFALKKKKKEANSQFKSYLEANFMSVLILCEPNFKLSLLWDVKN